jgi:hypothetical protein
MRRTVFVTTVSVLALFAAGHAAAQTATPVRVGQSVSGALTEQDSRLDDDEVGNYVYDTYSLEARAGQRLEVVMRSGDFDAFLDIYKDDDSGEPITSDDDGLGEGTDSKARFTAERGTYIIRARTLSGFEGGAYTLQVNDRGAAPRAPRPGAIRLGDRLRGEIDGRDPVADGQFSEYTYDAFAFRAREGERFAISLESDDFDPIVRVGRADRSGSFEELAQNDDSGAGGLNSYLVFTAPTAGEYVIRAAALNGSSDGDYTLALEAGPPPLPTLPLSLDAPVDGRLDAEDGVNESGQRADVYEFTGREGQRIVATMSSDSFDTYLELFAQNGGNGVRQSLQTDDDGAGQGTNSRLAYTLPSDGQYTLEARAFGGSDGNGAYTLKLEETAPPPPPSALSFGETVQGEILEDGPRDDSNRGYADYVFTGHEGNRVQAIMRSGDFDTYLQIGSSEGEFEALGSDDDGLGEGTDSRLNYILPSSGEFIVRASPLYAEAKGLYSLELIDRGPQPRPGSILVGATARGSLGEDDALADDGSFYDAYRVSVKAGDKLRVTMASNEFDAYLDIGREDEDGGFTSVTSDDDGLSDTHAKIDWTVDRDGRYVIRAGSYASAQTGSYALTVEAKD